MSLSYNGFKVVPSPFITLNKTYQKTGDGSKVGVLWNITANGTLIPFRGSPSGNYSDVNDSFWTLGGNPPDEPLDVTDGAAFNSILRKQEALRNLFTQDGKSLEWQPAGGQPVVKCNPRILDITFSEGTWADRSDYTISMEADWIAFTNNASGEDLGDFAVDLIQSASETWSFDEIAGHETEAYRVTHSVTAKGIIGYDENGVSLGPAWQHARDWVDQQATGSIDTTVMSGAIGSTTYLGGSFVKSINVDEKTGSYSVNESWALSSGTTYIEESFSCTKALVDDTFTANYDGTIFGVSDGEGQGGDVAIANAKAQVPSNAAAKTTTEAAIGSFLGTNVLGDTPTTKNVGINNQNGTVTFSFQWSADELSTSSSSCEATLDFVSDTNIYSLRLTCDIEGIGETSEDRLANAKLAILSDAAALALAKSLVGDSLPIGVTIVSTPKSTSSSFNQKSGSIRTTFAWVSTNLSDPEITVQSTFPKDVSAIFVIPGRNSGPIIQDMNTQTERKITVTLSSKNNVSKPGNAITVSIMNTFAEGDFNTGDAATWLLDGDQDNYNDNTGDYNRTRTYIVR